MVYGCNQGSQARYTQEFIRNEMPKSEITRNNRSSSSHCGARMEVDRSSYESMMSSCGNNNESRESNAQNSQKMMQLAQELGYGKTGRLNSQEVDNMKSILKGEMTAEQLADIGEADPNANFAAIDQLVGDMVGPSNQNSGNSSSCNNANSDSRMDQDMDSDPQAPTPMDRNSSIGTSTGDSNSTSMPSANSIENDTADSSSFGRINQDIDRQPAPNAQPAPSSNAGSLADVPRDLSNFRGNTATIKNTGLSLDGNNKLSEQSKTEVAELLTDLSNAHNGNEVFGAVYRDNGNLSLDLTLGSSSSVNFNVPNDLVFSAHTHPYGSTSPSSTDRNNRLQGEEAIVVGGQAYSYA